MSSYNDIQTQLEQALRAFNQAPDVRLAGCIKRLLTARKNAFSPSRLVFNQVDVKRSPMPHHVQGLSYTASGYGEKIPTEYTVNLGGKWRRVYCRIFSNIGTTYICCHDGKYIVDFDYV